MHITVYIVTEQGRLLLVTRNKKEAYALQEAYSMGGHFGVVVTEKEV